MDSHKKGHKLVEGLFLRNSKKAIPFSDCFRRFLFFSPPLPHFRLFLHSRQLNRHFLSVVSNYIAGFGSSQITSQCQTSPRTAPEAVMRDHDGCHDMMVGWRTEFFLTKWHDMTGDPSGCETRRGGSGRPRRRCLGVDQGVENTSLLLRKRGRMKVCLCDHQWLYRNWKLKRQQ